MRPQQIATDVPAWLLNVFQKVNWSDLNFIEEGLLVHYVKNECASLPPECKKTQNYQVNTVNTSAPAEVIQQINLIDFNRMPTQTQTAFKDKIESNVQKHFGVVL